MRILNMRRVAIGVVAAVLLLGGGVAWATNPFTDISSDTHAADIDAIYNAGITSGCTATTYCPNNPVTRSQMATFLARVAAVGSTSSPHFPLTNAKGQTQSYCDTRSQIPRSLGSGPCQTMTEVVDSVGDSGTYSSVAIGTDGLPIVAHYESSSEDLRVVHCKSLTCTTGSTITVIDSVGTVGMYPSIAIGTDGLPVISYVGGDDLRVAHCTHIDCSVGTGITTVRHDANGAVGYFSALVIGNDGFPIISSYNVATNNVEATHCSNVTCTSNSTAILVGGTEFDFAPIAIGGDGLPFVGVVSAGNVFLVHCSNAACTSSTAAQVEGDPTESANVSLTMATDGLPLLSYSDVSDAVLIMVHCSTLTCSASSSSVVSGSGFGSFSQIRIGADGKPNVVYYDSNQKDLVVTHCASITSCTAANGALDTRLDKPGDVGGFPSVAIGIDGQPVIFYHDATNKNLKVARPPA